ncbi:MAG: hypothetical protein QW057_06475 [Candidatus Bathyarchaeia archaeon]
MRRALLALMVVAVLSGPPFFTQAYARVEEPSINFARAGYKDSRYTGFTVTVATQDGGRVDVTFAWQIVSRWREGDSLRVYDTYPTLQMIKLLENGSLDYSVTYIPLYLIQFDDVNENGLFDIRAESNLTSGISDEEVDWRLVSDTVLRMYPLAPMFNRFERGNAAYAWSWTVSEPSKAKAEDISRYEYAWNISSTIGSFAWRFSNYTRNVERDSMDVHLGYRLSLKSDGPTVKLEYSIEGVRWASGKDVKLALISAVLYHGREQVALKEERKYAGFSGGLAENQSVALVERASESVKSLLTCSTDAVVDGVQQMGAVVSSLQPLFVASTPVDVPGTVNVRGLNPSFEDKVLWRYSVAFANQLAFPRFDERIFQDPEISLIAPLLILKPLVFVSSQWFAVAVVTVSVVYTLLRAALKRWLRYPYVCI